MTTEISATMRDYLAEVYRLSAHRAGETGYVSTSALAELLDVSAPAVNRMVSKLRDLGLLEHEPYQGIRLTPDGEREALIYLRRHRIVEAFLVQVMGFRWHQVHDEADRIAAASSDTVTERMFTMAGSPSRCPHGEPIPARDGTLPPADDLPLLDAPKHTPLVLTRVTTRESDRLEYLAALQLMPGAHVELHSIAPFNGPIQLRLERGEYRIIGHNLAEMLRVRAE